MVVLPPTLNLAPELLIPPSLAILHRVSMVCPVALQLRLCLQVWRLLRCRPITASRAACISGRS
jgi:hypothetical protein